MSTRNVAGLLLVLVAAVVAYAARVMAVANDGVMTGVVSNASGDPIAGAFVKVRNAERKLTFMVVSQDRGRFRLAKLPPGKYEAQAVGDGMQTNPVATLALTAGKEATVNLTLTAPQPAPPEVLTAKDYGRLSAWSSHLPNTWMRADAANYMVVEYALPVNSDPHDLAVDSRGIAWVSERRTGMIGRFDPDTLTYTRIAVPAGTSKKFWLSATEVDPQDRVWTIDGVNGRLVQYDPKSETFNFFTIPDPPHGGVHFNTIRFHPDGSVWGTQSRGNQIVRLDPATKKVNTYDIPPGVTREGGAHPYGMAIDGNQKIWFAENGAAKVAKLDPSTGKITEFKLPLADARPRRMAADAQGDVWFCMGMGDWAQGGRLAKIDHRTNEITYYTPPTPNSGPSSPGVDKQRNLIWFSETPADAVARFDPRTKAFVEFPLPTWRSLVRRIEVDRSGPNRVWFAGSGVREDDSNLGYDKMGYLEVLK